VKILDTWKYLILLLYSDEDVIVRSEIGKKETNFELFRNVFAKILAE
jgi:hypothetical protein